MLLGSFAALFPEARFIFTIRDPRDVVCSLLRCEWRDVRDGQPLPYTHDPVAAARFSFEFMTLALQNARALEAEGRLMTVNYEELCTEPGGALARLGAFLHESTPKPDVAPDSARVVTESPDNPHPPLRAGALDTTSIARRRDSRSTLDPGPLDTSIEQLRAKLGYARSGSVRPL